MTTAEYRERMASGVKIVAGSPLHEVFHRHSQEAQRLLATINTGYHDADEVRAVLGAGAVVTKDVPPRSVVGGVPAKVLKTI